MKTIVVWYTMEGDTRFFVLEGDYSHLDDIYLNGNASEEDDKELNEILAYDENGKPKVEMLEEFPKELISADGNTQVIVCGFIP